jgi:hypothetical protein
MWAKFRESELGCCSDEWMSKGNSESGRWHTRVGDVVWKLSAVIPNGCHIVQTRLNLDMDEEA